jgi:hypothetical protein
MKYHRWALFIASVCFSFVFYSCSQKNNREVTRSYYYWRSNGEISNEEIEFLRDHKVSKLYVRLMDIDWSEVYGAIPVSTGRPDYLNFYINHDDSTRIDITPVVFITNKTFEKIDSSAIPLLAKRVIRRCLLSYDDEDKRYESEHRSYGQPFQPREIQLDCDWTAGTRDKYFYFLQQLKRLMPVDNILISATIRLHQFKYPGKTGVPPVNRGMLMVYNISDLRQYSPVNSIYDHDKAKAYFKSPEKYALPLDIVLPAYSWCIVFRDQKFYQIENGLSERDLAGLSFLQKKANGFYQVKQDTVFHDLFLRPGDEIKPEGIDSTTLQQAARLAKEAINTGQFAIAFFELSASEISNYSYESIEDIYHSYR